MRKIAVAAVVVVFILVILVVLIPRLVPVDSLRPRIVAALEEKTGRTIELSGLSLSLFPGIGVRVAGLSVSGDARHPEERLLSVPEAEIRLAIMPLFSGRAVFTKCILRRPQIRFRSYADGTHSATDIVRRFAGEKGSAAGTPAGKDEERVAVVLRTVSVEDAGLLLHLADKGGKESRWEISPLTLKLSGIGEERNDFEVRTRIEGQVRGEVSFAGSLSREQGAGTGRAGYAFQGKGELFGQKAEGKGTFSAERESSVVDLAITFPGIRPERMAEIFKDPPAALAKARLEGVIPLSVKVAGTLESPEFEARADLTRAGATLYADPELRKTVDTPCTIVAGGRYASNRLFLSNAELRMPPLSVTAKGVIHPGTGAREWEATATVSSLAETGKLPGAGLLSGWSPEGRLTASGKGRSERAAAPETLEGKVDLGGVGFRIPDRNVVLRGLTGTISLAPGSVAFSRLAGLLNGERFSLNGKASLGPVPQGQVDLRMAYLDVDALFPPGAGEKKEEKEAAAGKPGKGERRKREISARLDVVIDAGKARGVEFTDLKGVVRYEKGNLVFDSVGARMYGGNVALSGVVGLASPDPDFRVKVAVKEVAVEEILSRKTSLKDFLSGPMSLSADIGGGMKDFAEFSRTASGTGSVKLSGGRIKGLDLLSTAAGVAGLQTLVPGGRAAKGETPFSDVSASFTVEAGKIRTESLRLLSENLGLAGKAAVGFDRTLDFQGVLRLSKEMSARVRGTAGKFLVGPQGEVEIPLVMSGTLTDPAVSLDAAALARGAGERYLKEAIGGMIAPSPSPGADGTAKEAPGPKPGQAEQLKEVEGLIRKILPGQRR
jgi:uncharacterized protein involved in outer membrane biogenesis